MWTGGTSANSPRVTDHAKPIGGVPKADIRCVRRVEIGNVTRQMLSGHACKRRASGRVGTDRLTCAAEVEYLFP